MAAVHRSRSSLLLALLLTLGQPGWADSVHPGRADLPAYLAQIEAHDPAELSRILMRLELLVSADTGYPSSQPLALVLHGEEIRAFLRQNYGQNRELVDLAARLAAFNAVDIQVCETWLRDEMIERSELPAFIATVPYGPAQEKALLEQGYEYF